jgi:hypothetical protein
MNANPSGSQNFGKCGARNASRSSGDAEGPCLSRTTASGRAV